MSKIVSKPNHGDAIIVGAVAGREVVTDARLAPAFQRFFDDISQKLNDNLLGQQSQLTSYTVATLPAATTAGGMIYVSDETGGAVPAFSDGTDWRRFTDRAVVA